MAKSTRKLLVTSALPYANGSIHLGHLVEYIQTDIWVRFQRLRGNHCVYICADDTHGTPIMLNAQKQGVTPEALIARYYDEHRQDFDAFGVDFDYFGSTHTPENQALSEMIFTKANDQGAIESREIEQLYCETSQMFLPDRFVKGECPSCHAPDQYGDSCERCSATYSPRELLNPYSTLSGETPVLKRSLHYFFKLKQFQVIIEEWLASGAVRSEIYNKLKEWLKDGLKDWDISRDDPYFGFTIPGTTDKYFYVWVDAPLGYISSTQNWAKNQTVTAEEIWSSEDYEIHHFIGKDILYFHTLFWPAMLKVGGFSLPKKVHVHGFLTVNGEKMSKSRGTFITAKTYLSHFNPELLRYYYASKLNGSIDDLDLNLDDFVFKVNADVVNKVVNIGSRLGSILYKKCGGKLTTLDDKGKALLLTMQDTSGTIEEHFESLAFNKAMMLIMRMADEANKYIDEEAPWEKVKLNPDHAAQICTSGLNALRLIGIWLKPVMPELVKGIEAFLTIEPLTWEDVETLLTDQPIQKYVHLMQRVEREELNKLVLDPKPA